METWDWISSVLQLILAGYFTGEEDALALLVCPGLCHTLVAVLRGASAAAGDNCRGMVHY